MLIMKKFRLFAGICVFLYLHIIPWRKEERFQMLQDLKIFGVGLE